MKQGQNTGNYKTLSFLAALIITCIFITAAIADDNTKKAEELYSRGVEALGAPNNEKAIKYFEAVLKIDPDYADAHLGLGVANGMLGRYDEAEVAYKQAIRLNPDDSDPYFGLGALYFDMERYTEAAEALKQAIRINPNDAMVHYFLGLAYLLSGDTGSAHDEYEILKELDSKIANKLYNRINK